MMKALITCGQNPGVYFLEKWLAQVDFIYGDTVFIKQIPANQQVLLPRFSAGDYIHQLLNICLDRKIDAVFAMSFAEQQLLAEGLILFTEFNIKIYSPDLISCKQLSNPPEIFKTLQDCAIKTVQFQLSLSFSQFSKACLQLGYPKESVAVNLDNQDLIWIINDQNADQYLAKNPVISFTKAAKFFAFDTLLLLRKYQPSTKKVAYALFNDGKMESVWNITITEGTFEKIGFELKLNGLFEFIFQGDDQLFNIKPFAVA